MKKILRSHSLLFASLLALQLAASAPALAATCSSSDTDASSCQAVISYNSNDPLGTPLSISTTADSSLAISVAAGPGTSEGVRLDKGAVNILFDNYPDQCRYIDNNSSNDYFVPQATSAEFSDFLNSSPPGIVEASCVSPTLQRNMTDPVPPGVSSPAFENQKNSDGSYSILAETTTIAQTGYKLNVPMDQNVIGRAPPYYSTTVVNQDNNSNVIDYYYTRTDCCLTDAKGNEVSTQWGLLETQSLTFTTTLQLSQDGNSSTPAWDTTPTSPSWISNTTTSSDSAAVAVTYAYCLQSSGFSPGTTCSPQSSTYIGNTPTGGWSVIIKSCTDNTVDPAITYQDGQQWTDSTNFTQSPTAQECPFGNLSRVDNMQTVTTNYCDDGTTDAISTSDPTETGYTGACASPPPTDYADTTSVPINTLEASDPETFDWAGGTAQIASCTNCTGISVNSGAFVSGPVSVMPGDTVALQQLSSPGVDTQTTAALSIGTLYSVNWSITTNYGPGTYYVFDNGYSATSTPIVDAATNAVIGTLPARGATAINTATNRVYVASANAVQVFDGVTDQLLATIPVTVSSVGMDITVNSNTNMAYVGDFAGHFVVIDGATNTVVQTMLLNYMWWASHNTLVTGPCGYFSGMDADPNTNMVFLADYSCGQIWVINGASKTNGVYNPATIVQEQPGHGTTVPPLAIPLPAACTNCSPNDVKVDTANQTLYLPDAGGAPNVYVVSEQGGTISIITDDDFLGTGPEVAVNPVTNKIYVTSGSNGIVTEIDANTNTVIDHIYVADGAAGPAVNSISNTIYVAGNNYETEINGYTNQIVASTPFNGLYGAVTWP